MKVSLVGRVRNTKLSPSRPLLPVFEAAINSLQAIQLGNVKDGRIDIRVERIPEREIDAGDGLHAPIAGFLITDNGPGFNEENFQSFETSDSTLKQELGGRGVGRLLWLKAFEDVAVDSIFVEPGTNRSRRRFVFRLDDRGVNDDRVESVAPETPLATVVHLRHFRPEYREKCPKGLHTIAQKLIEHCLTYFIFGSAPTITLSDDKDTLNVNAVYKEHFAPNTERDDFQIGDNAFRATHVRLFSAEAGSQRLHFCAHQREVRDENLQPIIPNLVGRIADEDGKPFFWSTFVSGDFLDANVETERTAFTFPIDAVPLDPGEITLAGIKAKVIPIVKSRLDAYLAPVQREKVEKIQQYIRTKAPQYRLVEKYASPELEDVRPGLSDLELDVELHRLQFKIEADVRVLNARVTAPSAPTENDGELDSLIEKATDVGQASLAKYVAQRRVVLGLLEKTLGTNSAGKYAPESSVHRIIFPVKKTSDDILESQQNLWIIDERLAYHRFLASDKDLSSIPIITSESKDRPDLIVFNNPFAFAEGEKPYSSVVIVEFKRPVRDDFAEDENPITQVYGYVERVKNGEAKDLQGRPVTVSRETPFYCHIICDLTKKIRRFAEDASLTPAPDALGYFGFNANRNAYVDVTSYDKLVQDAKKRNRVFFDKLNLPLP
jgi:hypothetical protein